MLDYNKIGNRTYQALTNLYLNSLEMQDFYFCRDFREQDPLAHAKEYGTIKICGPRQSGHTTSIMKFLEIETTKPNKQITVLFFNLAMAKRFSEIFKDYLLKKGIIAKHHLRFNVELENENKIFFNTINHMDDLRGLSLNNIIVDCASLLKPSKINEIYKVGLPCMAFKPYVSFIFVE